MSKLVFPWGGDFGFLKVGWAWSNTYIAFFDVHAEVVDNPPVKENICVVLWNIL